MASSPTTLNLPDVPLVEFERNFIKAAVCELRFPTLLEFETKPPVQLQRELRRDYPHYEPEQSVSVGAGAVGREIRYLFKSRKKDWTVSFRASAIALETTSYTNFEEFSERLKDLLVKSQRLLDSVTQFNHQSFRFFRWVIGPKALERLGKAALKPGRK